MKILLLNDNPVVNKLVTLSAQKTSDEVDIASNIEGLESQNYDLLIVDDSVYSDDLLHELNAKIKYKKSLFICAKDAQEVESFSSILKKPFLPTDLVELFMMFEKEIANEPSDSNEVSEEIDEESVDDVEDLNEDLDWDDELLLDEELNLDDEENLGESVLDDEEAQKVKDLLDENEEELSFEEEVQDDIESLELDELDELGDDEEEISLEEVEEPEIEKSEIEEDPLSAYNLALDLEDEADVDISEEDSFDLEDEVETLEDEELEELETATVEELEDEIDEVVTDELNAKEGDMAYDLALDLEDEADVDISDDIVDDLNLDEITEELEETKEPEEVEEESAQEEQEEINLEDEIQNAVENLTQEDLESELDEDTLLKIATNEIDPLESLNSKDLKMALGEEVDEEEPAQDEVELEVAAADTPPVAELVDIIDDETPEQESVSQNSGVESLKKLLEALSDKDIAASLKGAKISINITLGENS